MIKDHLGRPSAGAAAREGDAGAHLRPYPRWSASFPAPTALELAAARGVAWAVRKQTARVTPGARLTTADMAFLEWLAAAAISLSMAENESTVEE